MKYVRLAVLVIAAAGGIGSVPASLGYTNQDNSSSNSSNSS